MGRQGAPSTAYAVHTILEKDFALSPMSSEKTNAFREGIPFLRHAENKVAFQHREFHGLLLRGLVFVFAAGKHAEGVFAGKHCPPIWRPQTSFFSKFPVKPSMARQPF